VLGLKISGRRRSVGAARVKARETLRSRRRQGRTASAALDRLEIDRLLSFLSLSLSLSRAGFEADERKPRKSTAGERALALGISSASALPRVSKEWPDADPLRCLAGMSSGLFGLFGLSNVARPPPPSPPPPFILPVGVHATSRGFGCTRPPKGQESNSRAADSPSPAAAHASDRFCSIRGTSAKCIRCIRIFREGSIDLAALRCLHSAPQRRGNRIDRSAADDDDALSIKREDPRSGRTRRQ